MKKGRFMWKIPVFSLKTHNSIRLFMFIQGVPNWPELLRKLQQLKHFCRSVRYSGKLLSRCRQWLTKNYRQSHYPCLSTSAKKYTSNESLCLTHLHSPGQNDWSLKHSWTNTHGGLNQAKPDHQADSSQFVLLFNKADKNHQRGSVRHYSALLYE